MTENDSDGSIIDDDNDNDLTNEQNEDNVEPNAI